MEIFADFEDFLFWGMKGREMRDWVDLIRNDFLGNWMGKV
jgi:hypothetical protein